MAVQFQSDVCLNAYNISVKHGGLVNVVPVLG